MYGGATRRLDCSCISADMMNALPISKADDVFRNASLVQRNKQHSAAEKGAHKHLLSQDIICQSPPLCGPSALEAITQQEHGSMDASVKTA